MNFSGLFSIRQGKKDDEALVLSTFLRGLYYGSIDKKDSSKTLVFGLMPKDVFMAKYKLVAQALLADKNTEVRVACLPDDPDVILGYAILSKDLKTLYYVFTKTAWRQRGIASALVPRDVTQVSHLTRLGQSLLYKLPNAIFNPFF